jgi:hypothetical protein
MPIKVEQKSISKFPFERKGYSSAPHGPNIAHIIEKVNESTLVGYSTINNNGVLTNVFEVPVSLRQMGISRAMYQRLNSLGFNAIEASYNPVSDNFKAFLKVYSPTKSNDVEAAMATPAAKAMGPGFYPSTINVESKEGQKNRISITWSKKIN